MNDDAKRVWEEQYDIHFHLLEQSRTLLAEEAALSGSFSVVLIRNEKGSVVYWLIYCPRAYWEKRPIWYWLNVFVDSDKTISIAQPRADYQAWT